MENKYNNMEADKKNQYSQIRPGYKMAINYLLCGSPDTE